MCCTIISKYIIWKYCLIKWTDAILAKVSVHSPLQVNSRLQITSNSQTLPLLKSNSVLVICLMVSIQSFNNIRVPRKNLKKVPDFCVWGGEFCSKHSTLLEKKNNRPPPKKPQNNSASVSPHLLKQSNSSEILLFGSCIHVLHVSKSSTLETIKINTPRYSRTAKEEPFAVF